MRSAQAFHKTIQKGKQRPRTETSPEKPTYPKEYSKDSMDDTYPQHEGVAKNIGKEHRNKNLWVSAQVGSLVGPGYQLLDELRIC